MFGDVVQGKPGRLQDQGAFMSDGCQAQGLQWFALPSEAQALLRQHQGQPSARADQVPHKDDGTVSLVPHFQPLSPAVNDPAIEEHGSPAKVEATPGERDTPLCTTGTCPLVAMHAEAMHAELPTTASSGLQRKDRDLEAAVADVQLCEEEVGRCSAGGRVALPCSQALRLHTLFVPCPAPPYPRSIHDAP